MSFFVVVKGCVNFHEMTSAQKNAYLHAESFRKLERFLNTTALLLNLIPPCFYYLTNLVSCSKSPVVLEPRSIYGRVP